MLRGIRPNAKQHKTCMKELCHINKPATVGVYGTMDSITAVAICASFIMFGGVIYVLIIACLSRICLRSLTIHPTSELHQHQHQQRSRAHQPESSTEPQCIQIPNVVRQPDGTIVLAFDAARLPLMQQSV